MSESPGRDPEAAAPAVPDDVRQDPAARGALYALIARAFTEPDEELYAVLADGSLDRECRRLLDATTLDVEPPDLVTDDDRETLCARYNDLFVIGYSEVVDGTDGTVENQGPPVPLYESAYREDVSWNDVNLDLARVYDYFGVEVDQSRRENHDHLRLVLEFAGYLCRREAAVDSGVARARLDFHDRHLRVVTEGVAGKLADEAGTDVFGELAAFLDRFSAADVADLDDRLDAGVGPGSGTSADRDDGVEAGSDAPDADRDDGVEAGSDAPDADTDDGGDAG